MRSVAFIVNPRSGTRRRQAAWARTGEVGGLLPGCETSLYATRCAGDAYRQAKRCVDAGCDVVVAVGGDGTVNEVARALMHTPAALAIIPAGSGNGLARHLKIPMNARKALDLINRFRVQPVDAARINDRFFFCTAGVGFDALVGARFNASETRGLANYVRFAASAFRRYTPQEYRLRIDGQPLVRTAMLITFANASQWGNNATVAPLADVCDGQLDVVVWKSAPRGSLPFLIVRLFTRSLHRSPHIETFRGRHITLERPREDAVHLDGESSTMGERLDVEIIPRALHVVC